ncbi:MAG: DUF2254 domain-containing protein [Opitutaceae bacterium]|nr:DUF2254 domain-containing protein [Opitutaceae bacterium]
MTSLKSIWGNLRSSFWFIPALIVADSIVLAVALIDADSRAGQTWMARWPHLFGAGAAGARGMLSTIAGSMMTVVGVTFSMTLITLTLASSQYTSRILRNFMRDRVTQVVLGIFAGIFTYCLVVLRTIRGGDDSAFVPSLAVTGGVVLAIGGIGVLIFFIHHIASSIQASHIIASVARETLEAIDRLFPTALGQGPDADHDDQAAPALSERKWCIIPVKGMGYIQNVDNTALLRLAREHKTIVRMELGVGEFAVAGTPLVSVVLESPPAKELISGLQAAFGLSRYRTVEQDAAFGIRQIVDMALRALSPGSNDTTTGIVCVDYLRAILARLVARNIPSSPRYEEGQLRVIASGPTFASLVAESFDQIRASGSGNVAILVRMLDAVQTVASLTASPGRRRVLRDHAHWLAETAERTLESPRDRLQFETRHAEVRAALAAAPASTPDQPAIA